MFSHYDAEVLSETDEVLYSTVPHVAKVDNASTNILLVEDTTSDSILMRIALDASHVPYTLQTLRKGNDVLPCLLHHRQQGENHIPDVMILDLGLPGMDGFDVLEGIAAAPASIRAIPIIILSSYEQFDYLWKGYQLSIPACLKKPCNVEKVQEILMHVRRGKSVPDLH